MPPNPPHDEFLELCAVSTTGQLTTAERAKLDQHLVACASCREAMRQFEAVVDLTAPALFPHPQIPPGDDCERWSEQQAEAALFTRLAEEQELSRPVGEGSNDAGPAACEVADASDLTWRGLWSLYAAALLLSAALGFSAYRVGVRRAAQRESTPTGEAKPVPAALGQQALAEEATASRDTIASLRRELELQSAELVRLRAAEARLEGSLRGGDAARADLIAERNRYREQAQAAEASVESLETRLQAGEQRTAEQAARLLELEAQASDLAHSLHSSQETVEQQKELLAHDRDIRELIGARDLYIAEIYDVARTGVTQKPYGRVFYTQGKSLVFYAYDLDQQAGLKSPSSFQAWGRRGPDRTQALSLGLFNADNPATKRWVLRFADAKALTQIDAVFVTVEPSGGSPKPSTQPLLFAYLRVEPNHP